MLNLLQCDLYRMARTFYFWVYVAIIVCSMIGVAAMMAYVSSPEFTVMVNERMIESGDFTPEAMEEINADIAEAEPLNTRELQSLTHTWANTFLGGGFLGLFTACALGIFFVRDFKTGFIKNLNMSSQGRARYFTEKLIFVGVVDALFLALAVIATTGAYQAFGFTYAEAESAGAIALWLFLAWLLVFAYSCLTACIAWLVRSEGVVAAFGILVCSCLAGSFFIQLALLFGKAFPVFNAVPYWTLAGSAGSLADGANSLTMWDPAFPIPVLYPWGQTLLTELIFVGVALAVTYGVCRKRNVA